MILATSSTTNSRPFGSRTSNLSPKSQKSWPNRPRVEATMTGMPLEWQVEVNLSCSSKVESVDFFFSLCFFVAIFLVCFGYWGLFIYFVYLPVLFSLIYFFIYLSIYFFLCKLFVLFFVQCRVCMIFCFIEETEAGILFLCLFACS